MPAPAPQQAAPAPAPAAPAQKSALDKKAEALGILYAVAAITHVCDIDLADDEDEKLQNAVDKAEADLGLPESDRDALWLSVGMDIEKEKAKVCTDAPADVVKLIRSLP